MLKRKNTMLDFFLCFTSFTASISSFNLQAIMSHQCNVMLLTTNFIANVAAYCQLTYIHFSGNNPVHGAPFKILL